MKRISLLIVALSALLASCSSPYYPEYVDIISVGAVSDTLVCECEEGEVALSVISNVEFTATLTSGTDWLRFADIDSFVYTGKGNESIKFEHLANNHDKRVAYLVIAAQGVERIIKIKQKSPAIFEDYLEFDPDDVLTKLTLNEGTRIPVSVVGGMQKLQLRTSCLDHQITCTSDHANAITDIKIENKVLSFFVNENNEGQPRIINVTLSYVDGWDDVKELKFSVKQGYNE